MQDYLALLTLKRFTSLRDVPKRARLAVTPPGMATDDWKIIRALSEVTTSPVIVIMFLCSAQIGYTLATSGGGEAEVVTDCSTSTGVVPTCSLLLLTK